MKYKVGDKVRIKSIDWYNEYKDMNGNVFYDWEQIFNQCTALHCGQVLTIKHINSLGWYEVEEGAVFIHDGMIEGLVECDNNMNNMGKLVAEKVSGKMTIAEPKYSKLTVNTEFCDDKVELAISPDYELKQEGDKWFVVKKKKEYPKTYEECYRIIVEMTGGDCNPKGVMGYKARILESLQKLLVCRDAYWKIAGEEMGLGKPWKPNSDTEVYNIYRFRDNIDISGSYCVGNSNILEFPTLEMRDTFCENFEDLIEQCKELL